jgi:hypothetical protein
MGSMTKLVTGVLLAAAAALTLAACTKAPAEPADATPQTAPPPASAPAEPAAPAEAAAPAASALPADMQAAAENFEMCEHWAGEEPYDAGRRKEIEDGITASCGPLKAALPGLKARYGSDPAMKTLLDQWSELAN